MLRTNQAKIAGKSPIPAGESPEMELSKVDALAVSAIPRWELYRSLSEPLRLRVLALAAQEELSVGELAELLSDSQPNVSRHVTALRRLSLVDVRKQGTRVFVSAVKAAKEDAVIRDALLVGTDLCRLDGSLQRVHSIVAKREDAVAAYFAEGDEFFPKEVLSPELPAYLSVLSPLLAHGRDLVIDVGTGDGRWLDVLSPLFREVIGFDRSEAQLEQARERMNYRGYQNVSLRRGDYGDAKLRATHKNAADLVIAARVLHHAASPQMALSQLAEMVKPGGHVAIVDYLSHDDERMREQRADVWLGFQPKELTDFAKKAKLEAISVLDLGKTLHEPMDSKKASDLKRNSERPRSYYDAHLPLQVLIARK